MDEPVKNKILKFIKERKSVTGTTLRKHFGVSRQAINIHIQRLVDAGKILQLGSKSGTVYVDAEGKEIIEVAKLRRYYENDGNLNANDIFDYYKKVLLFEKTLNENAYKIVKYAFISSLDKAIHRSQAKKIFIYIGIYKDNITFIVRDFGIGIFPSIQKTIDVTNEYQALGAFLKGDIKGMGKKGLTILSKLGDNVQIKSQRANATFDNINNNVIIKNIVSKKGTHIEFTIDRETNRRLDKYIDGIKWKEPDVIINVFRIGKKAILSKSSFSEYLEGFYKLDKLTFDFNNKIEMPKKMIEVILDFFSKKYKTQNIQTINITKSLKKQLRL